MNTKRIPMNTKRIPTNTKRISTNTKRIPLNTKRIPTITKQIPTNIPTSIPFNSDVRTFLSFMMSQGNMEKIIILGK